jgi:hypothetical protein
MQVDTAFLVIMIKLASAVMTNYKFDKTYNILKNVLVMFCFKLFLKERKIDGRR